MPVAYWSVVYWGEKMSDSVELWMVCISAAAGVIPWAFSIHAKVAVIAETIQSLPGMVTEVRNTLMDHERRLDTHEQKITAIETAAATGD